MHQPLPERNVSIKTLSLSSKTAGPVSGSLNIYLEFRRNYVILESPFALALSSVGLAARFTGGATFIEVGAVSNFITTAPPERVPAPAPLDLPSLTIRIDLGGGAVPTIGRR